MKKDIQSEAKAIEGLYSTVGMAHCIAGLPGQASSLPRKTQWPVHFRTGHSDLPQIQDGLSSNIIQEGINGGA